MDQNVVKSVEGCINYDLKKYFYKMVSHLSRTVQGLLLEKKKRKEKKEKNLLLSFVKSAAGSQEHVFSVVVPFIEITFVQ